MISSWRIPMLTEQMMTATLKAAAQQRRHERKISQPSTADVALAGSLVRRLTEMGYVVYVDRAA
jgi:hypothetical protein